MQPTIFDRLIKALEKNKDFFLEKKQGEKMSSLYKGVVKGSRAKILKGRLRDLKPNTVKIRKKAGQMPPTPLLRTGKLYKSIHAKKDGVYVEDYGINHLEGYTIRAGSNKFTEHWKKDVKVAPRNFLDYSEVEITSKDMQYIYNKINKIIKAHVRSSYKGGR